MDHATRSVEEAPGRAVDWPRRCGFAIRDLSYFVLGICAVIFIVVAGLLAYSLIRFRRRPADADREPPQVYGSNQIELAWTVVPVLIVVILFLATARYIFGIEGLQATPSALNVTVVGHQWWWEIRYPALGITTANELHVPVSDPVNPTPIFLTLESADVIHSFWVPLEVESHGTLPLSRIVSDQYACLVDGSVPRLGPAGHAG